MNPAAELIKELSEEKTRLVNENVLLKEEVIRLKTQIYDIEDLIRNFKITDDDEEKVAQDVQDLEDTVASVATDNKRDTIRKYR